jgi:DNA-binding transcriptional LysR family regulator
VACPVTLAQTVLAELMPAFLARYPLVRMEMLVNNRVVDLVEEGVDVALRVRTTLDDSGSLVVKRLGDDAPVLVASPALLARQGTPTTLDELSRLDSMAMSTTDGRASIPLTGPDGRQTTLQHTPRYVADDLLTLHVAALAGTGMCWLPSYMCEDDLRQGRLVRLLPDWQTPRGLVHAVFPSRRGLTPAVRCFLDFLGEHVPTHSSLLGSEAPGQVP